MIARLTDGSEIYPHRGDLKNLPFWRCDACGNYVGCHYKSKTPTQPLGVIPTQALRTARQTIHRVLDPLWKNGRISRRKLYRWMSEELGWRYHTASIRSMEEVKAALETAKKIAATLEGPK